MAVQPLPLSVVEISAVVDAHGTPLERRELDDAVMGIDVWFLEQGSKGKGRSEDVGADWAATVAQINGEG